MNKGVYTILLLIMSNSFMTVAWYGHLKFKQISWLSGLGLLGVILISWGIAFFEYCLQVPANRIGFFSGAYSLTQLKIIKEVITLTVFVPFAIFFMKQPLTLNYLWAGICLIGAVYFIFK